MANETHDINDIKRRMQGASSVAQDANCPACAPAAPPRTCSIR